MNAGFSNVFSLKAQILAMSLQTDTDYDAMIISIGLGVAGQIEKFCQRKFAFTTGFQEVFGADRASFVLKLFPVMPPITTVEFKQDEPTGWIVQNQNIAPNQISADNQLVIQSLDAENGIIYFPDNEDCGEYWSQMRFTYTGGYFWEQLEPTDAGYPTAPPAGSTPLPPSLLLAWQLQVRKVWEAIDKLGTQIVHVGSNAHNPADVLAGLDLIPQVQAILQNHIRWQLT
jgi:hypothetical protein